MTMRYAHFAPGYLRNEVRLLDEVGSTKRATCERGREGYSESVSIVEGNRALQDSEPLAPSVSEVRRFPMDCGAWRSTEG